MNMDYNAFLRSTEVKELWGSIFNKLKQRKIRIYKHKYTINTIS